MGFDTFSRLEQWQPCLLPCDLLVNRILCAVLSKLHSSANDERSTETALIVSQTRYLSRKEKRSLRKPWQLSQASQVRGYAGGMCKARNTSENKEKEKKRLLSSGDRQWVKVEPVSPWDRDMARLQTEQLGGWAGQGQHPRGAHTAQQGERLLPSPWTTTFQNNTSNCCTIASLRNFS